MTDQRSPDYLRAREVAEILRLTIGVVKAIPSSDLPYVRLNTRGDRRYDRADVEAFLAARRQS